jgi:ABC-type phosphate transport system ATPase subunit
MTITSDRQTAVGGELSNVNKFYGSRRVLDDISLEVRANEIVALVGRSECGKSTGAAALPVVRRADQRAVRAYPHHVVARGG